MAGHAKSAAERQRKREEAIALGLSQPTHPPIEKGEQLALRHGAHSEVVYAGPAERLLAEKLADPEFPEYAKKPSQRETLISYCRVCVQCDLLWDYIFEVGLIGSMTELAQTREKVVQEASEGGEFNGTQRRKASTATRSNPLETIRRFETLKVNLAKELGLTPMAQTKMGRDVAATQVSLANLIQDESDADGDD